MSWDPPLQQFWNPWYRSGYPEWMSRSRYRLSNRWRGFRQDLRERLNPDDQITPEESNQIEMQEGEIDPIIEMPAGEMAAGTEISSGLAEEATALRIGSQMAMEGATAAEIAAATGITLAVAAVIISVYLGVKDEEARKGTKAWKEAPGYHDPNQWSRYLQGKGKKVHGKKGKRHGKKSRKPTKQQLIRAGQAMQDLDILGINQNTMANWINAHPYDAAYYEKNWVPGNIVAFGDPPVRTSHIEPNQWLGDAEDPFPWKGGW